MRLQENSILKGVKNKTARIQKIKELVSGGAIDSQSRLLELLRQSGFDLTQATLSRDLKRMRIAKVGDGNGGYVYILPESARNTAAGHVHGVHRTAPSAGFVSIDFSGQFCVIKTRPGYAGGIALDIDALDSHAVMGTIAGDDTILVILRENESKQQVMSILKNIIPSIEEKTE